MRGLSITRWSAWFPAGLWAGTLFGMSSRPAGPGIPPWFLAHDKITHALAFGALAALVFFALRTGHRASASIAALGAWLLASLYGGADEIHQMFVPSRTPDGRDLLADSAGAALAAGSLWLWRRASEIRARRARSVRPAG